MPLDEAADAFAAQYLHARQPPAIPASLRSLMYPHLGQELKPNHQVSHSVAVFLRFHRFAPTHYDPFCSYLPSCIYAQPRALTTQTPQIRLVSRHCARLAIEDDAAVLYHHANQSRVFHAQPDPEAHYSCVPALCTRGRPAAAARRGQGCAGDCAV